MYLRVFLCMYLLVVEGRARPMLRLAVVTWHELNRTLEQGFRNIYASGSRHSVEMQVSLLASSHVDVLAYLPLEVLPFCYLWIFDLFWIYDLSSWEFRLLDYLPVSVLTCWSVEICTCGCTNLWMNLTVYLWRNSTYLFIYQLVDSLTCSFIKPV